MIAELLRQYGAGYRKSWAFDRSATVGSSEIGQCLRKTGFSKAWEVVPDPEYVEGWGYQLRGNVIEDGYFVPALRASLPDGVRLLYAGEDQQTFALGFLSATPDGLMTGVSRQCLIAHGIKDIGPGCCICVECKSLDPRSTEKLPKFEHTYQVIVAMGLLRLLTDHQPEYAVITYIDASDYSKVQEFAVRFDQAQFDEAENRAWAVMSAKSPGDLLPEGKLSGGKECQYCAFQRQCGDGELARLPGDNGVRLPPDAVVLLKEIRDMDLKLADSIEKSTEARAKVREAAKQLLQQHGARAHKEVDGSWSVVWSVVKGRVTLDAKALEASGVDLDLYQKEGSPSERLNIT